MGFINKLTKLRDRLTHHYTYKRTWGTPVGQDCVSLDTALCKWLGDRLVFFAAHTHGYPSHGNYSYEDWCQTCKDKAAALHGWGNRYEHTDLDLAEERLLYASAQEALRWVADNLNDLWD